MVGSFTPPTQVGGIRRTTPNYNFLIPSFDAPGWGISMEANFAVVDSVLFSLTGVGNVRGSWDNSTTYAEGDRVSDDSEGRLYQCLVDHTSASSGTFAEERVAQPTYWRAISGGSVPRGQWETATVYNAGEFVTDAGRTGIIVSQFESTTSYDDDVSDGNIVTIVDVSAFQDFATSINAADPITVLAGDDLFGVLDDTDGLLKQFSYTSLISASNLGGLYQPLDADLTAIAALSTTAYGRALLTQSNEAAFKQTTNLETGIDVQAWSANLDEYASVNPSAFVLTLLDDANAGTFMTTLGISAFIQTLMDDANAAAARTTLGLVIGTDVQAFDADTLKGDVADQTITGGARVTPLPLTNLSGQSITPDPGDRPIMTITNNGAGSILPGSNNGIYTLIVSNTTGAGAITTTGWTLVGASFDTTTTSVFLCSCIVAGTVKVMIITKLV